MIIARRKIMIDKYGMRYYNLLIKPFDWPLNRAFRRVSEGGKIMSEVHIKDNESLDSALKRFKRNCAKSGVLSDLRKKEYYQSPSVKRRKKSEAARKNKNKKYN